uniref:Uncharacterized protein n=1 Tax=Vibrio cholerae TaxID=666 RepID=A0A2Z2GBM7_VIBCL|nr:hypothetical protein [Vibrio cholerae]ARK08013.1 hypothetical protein [Vibrio cholerae]ARK08020.1 hypothetical protein [Vibrio cholerae]ARK08027.1 hypothetical protein [Vibrio cholerae]ARK08105.1 hypothetical protein [Vibrio cholerae]
MDTFSAQGAARVEQASYTATAAGENISDVACGVALLEPVRCGRPPSSITGVNGRKRLGLLLHPN